MTLDSGDVLALSLDVSKVTPEPRSRSEALDSVIELYVGHLNRGGRWIMQSDGEYSPGDVWYEGVDVMLLNGRVIRWNQSFVVVKRATRQDYEAERVMGTTLFPHTQDSRYYEVAAD